MTQDKKVLSAIIKALGAELNELANVYKDLKEKRWLDKAVGVQLDGLGEIVGRNRELKEAIALKFFGFFGQTNVAGFEQARFRDEDEDVLASYKMQDAEYRRMLANAVDMIIRAAGVNLRYKSYFNNNHFFGFRGQPNAKGFDVGSFANTF